MSTGPIPQRLSDAERDEAAEMLRQHFTEGRLDQVEFEQRLGAALTARFAADLVPLFVDLPDPRPDAAGPAPAGPAVWPPQWTPAAQPPPLPVPWMASPGEVLPAQAQAQRSRMIATARALIWPVAIVLLITHGWFGWILLAVIGSIILKQLDVGGGRKPPPQLGR